MGAAILLGIVLIVVGSIGLAGYGAVRGATLATRHLLKGR